MLGQAQDPPSSSQACHLPQDLCTQTPPTLTCMHTQMHILQEGLSLFRLCAPLPLTGPPGLLFTLLRDHSPVHPTNIQIFQKALRGCLSPHLGAYHTLFFLLCVFLVISVLLLCQSQRPHMLLECCLTTGLAQ